MTYRSALSFASLFALSTAAASAGALVDGSWTPSACGTAPPLAQLDLSSQDAYNRSVEKVNAYHKGMDAYLSCMVKEANNDIQLITQTAHSAQQAAQRANEKIVADEKAARKKFRN